MIEDFNNDITKGKKKIHMVFYLISSNQDRPFFEQEIKFLKYFINFNIPIFFLLTFSEINDNSFKNKEKKDA